MTETFYDVLDVERTATQGEITDAYRQKVKEYHPDVSERDDAAAVFKRVVQAEEVLGDEAERERYDRLGHDAYVRRVEGANAAGSEQSPWTTEDRRENTHDAGFGGMDAGASTVGDARSQSRSQQATQSAGVGGDTGDADSSMGFGRAASRQSSAGWSEDTDSYNRWSEDAYNEGGIGGDDSSFAVRDWDEEEGDAQAVTLRFTQQFAIFSAALFVIYPMILYLISPSFPPVVNLVGALCILLVVGYSLTVPKLSLVAFGAWSLLAPIAVLTVTSWSLWVEALALLAAWVPFGFAVVVAYFARPT